MAGSTADEVSFPEKITQPPPPQSSNGSVSRSVGSNNGATRVRAMTQSSRQSGESSISKYKHVPRPVPVWVVDEQRSRHHFQQPRTELPSYFQHSAQHSRDMSYGATTDNELQPFYSGQSEMYDEASVPKSRWNAFKQVTTRPEVLGANQGQIDEKALLEQGDYSGAWVGDTAHGTHRGRRSDEPYPLSTARYFVSEQSRKVWKPRLAHMLLNNPYVPLTLRTIIFILSAAALGLACSIYEHSTHALPVPITQQPSTIMAVVVQTTALVYLVYITYDEYSGKPLGLREPKAKMRLIMLDLLFIIFSSANLSLTFNTLYDVTWTCHVGHGNDDPMLTVEVPYNFAICSRQRGLASFLFMVLVMWVATFTISIFRLVERVAQ